MYRNFAKRGGGGGGKFEVWKKEGGGGGGGGGGNDTCKTSLKHRPVLEFLTKHRLHEYLTGLRLSDLDILLYL